MRNSEQLTYADRLIRFARLCVRDAPPDLLRHEWQELNSMVRDQDWIDGKTGMPMWGTAAWALIVRLHHGELEMKKLKAELRAIRRAAKEKKGCDV